jgi:hypothetical protein
LLLNKLDKHATAVFSGEVPSTLEFLQPEGTIEKNTDSLRDFIIALDKSKADKLRYKVEDQLVRIFITPYRTSITQNDLEFSQGDFNVDLVVALGVGEQADLDTAITAHGRIMHDATVSTINATIESTLGSINWHGPQASSLCELVVQLAHTLGKDLLDTQIATALLTGIVAETARFSNEKTSPQTMSVSAELLSAGADQQLVASKLQKPEEPETPEENPETPSADSPSGDSSDTTGESEGEQPPETPSSPPKPEDGTLEIEHPSNDDSATSEELKINEPEQPAEESSQDQSPEPMAPEQPEASPEEPPATAPESEVEPSHDQSSTNTNELLSPGPRLVVNPPTLGGTLTANSRPEALEPSLDPLGLSTAPASELLDHSTESAAPAPQPPKFPDTPLPKAQEPLLTGFTPPPPAWVPPSADAMNMVNQHEQTDEAPAPQPLGVIVPQSNPDTTLEIIEEAVNSPHLHAELDSARDEVQRALDGAPVAPTPIQALNAQPLGDALHSSAATVVPPAPLFAIPPAPTFTSAPTPQEPSLQLPAIDSPPVVPAIVTPSPIGQPVSTENAAPPVPPPIPYHFGGDSQSGA